MSSLFDPINLILLAVALVVLWRLKSVLGTRTGNERPSAEVTVLRPRKADVPAPAADEPALGVQDREPAKPVWHGVAEEGSDTAKALQAVADKSPDFTVADFVDGAKRAYELILTAYANGDKSALKTLLAGEVLQTFSSAIDRRIAEDARFIFQFVGVNRANVVRAALDGRNASITIRFRSEMIQALVAKDGQVQEGDDKAVREVEDIWTFERDVTNRDPNWKLIATDDDIG